MGDGGRARRPRLTIAAEIATILGLFIAVVAYFELDKKVASLDVGAWLVSPWEPIGKWWAETVGGVGWIVAVQRFGDGFDFVAMVLWTVVLLAATFLGSGYVTFLLNEGFGIGIILVAAPVYLIVFWGSVSIAGAAVAVLATYVTAIGGAIYLASALEDAFGPSYTYDVDTGWRQS
jgi:hypothetical protein